MKQFILIGALSGWLLVTIPLRAQVAPRDSDARKGSRLELGRTASTRKTSAPLLSNQRFTIAPNPSGENLDRSVTLRKNAAINEHYRTVLVARPLAKATSRSGASDNSPAATADVRPIAGTEGKGEDRMFANDRLWVSNAYPNPADDAAELDYQITGPVNDAKLTMLNVLGAPVGEYVLDRGERKVRLATRDLATGYYLYQLSVDGKKVATKRLLVRHQ